MEPGGSAEPSLIRRIGGRAAERPALSAVGLYIILRGVGLIVLAVWASNRHRDFFTLLGNRYDARHYVSIAEHGYSTMNLAFFPLFPALIRALLVLPMHGPTAALLIAWVGSLFAAAGLFSVGRLVGGARTGLFLVALWAVLPHALVETMGYTEGIFTAFAAWSIYHALRERWALAGVLCLLAALTRPTGLALIAALGVVAVVRLVRDRQLLPLLAPALGLAGWAGYIGWVGARLGRLDGWFWVQRTLWHSRFDGGHYNLNELTQLLGGRRVSVVVFVVTAVVASALLFFVLSISGRQPLVLIVYSAAILVLTLGSDTGSNKARLLIPAFGLLLPPASALARARPRDAIAIIATLTVVSAWFGGYLALVWHWSP